MTWLQSCFRIRNRGALFAPLSLRRFDQRSGPGNTSALLMIICGGGGALCWIHHHHHHRWNDEPTKCHGGGVPSEQRRRKLMDFIHSNKNNKSATNNAGSDLLLLLPEYTSGEVSKRNGQDGGPIWMSYGGYVYSVKEFIPLHPGGTERISRAAGAAIEPYWFLHQQHFDTEEPMQIMNTMVVGRLAKSDQERIDEQLESLQQEMDTFRLELVVVGGGKITNLSLQDLKGFPKTDIKGQVGCPNNPGRRPVSTSIFGGVLLKELIGNMNHRQEVSCSNNDINDGSTTVTIRS